MLHFFQSSLKSHSLANDFQENLEIAQNATNRIYES